MTKSRLIVAVSGPTELSMRVSAAISDVASQLLDESDDGPAIIVQVAEEPATKATAAAHHLVVAVGSAQPLWSDLSIASEGEAETLAVERLVPWAIRWHEGRRAPRAQIAVLADPDPTWASTAARLIARLHSHTARLPVLRIDHIGSTSVPGLPAKDLIDVQITVAGDSDASAVAQAATGAGFVHVSGEWFGKDRGGDPHPEQVCVDADPFRPVNVNIRGDDRPVARDAVLYRDWLRANPDGRDGYLALKTELAGRHVDDYADRKEQFISAALQQAETWASQTGWTQWTTDQPDAD